jgi:pyruvate,orthophosphate dikinase
MILAENEQERRGYLRQLLPMQRADFVGILEAMAGLPVTIRLLDPPLHEFLPDVEELADVVRSLPPGAREHGLLLRARALHESNPMLGHRGVRLGISHPEVYEMQIRAIFEATADLVSRGVDARPEIMVPLVGLERELAFCRELIARVAGEVEAESGLELDCHVGTMIEIPRACLVAGAIAEHAEFFSFGTNDLTQTTFGFSRDDAEAKFLARYLDSRILSANPFVTIDRDGVGELVKLAVEGGRRVRQDLKIGICGEHGGDPASIAFFHEVGLDYVSCSPYRVPIARLAAAQAGLSATDLPSRVTSPSA